MGGYCLYSGPDGLIGELIKWLLPNGRGILLNVCNRQYNARELEESLHLASVASIYKKG